MLRIGHDKAGRDRRIKLPEATSAFFIDAAKNKLPQAPLLSRSGGQAYVLRHSVISDLVHEGLDLLTVAQISGTSVVMIERHYGHLRSEVAVTAQVRRKVRRA